VVEVADEVGDACSGQAADLAGTIGFHTPS
jgi:hypothetical protein